MKLKYALLALPLLLAGCSHTPTDNNTNEVPGQVEQPPVENGVIQEPTSQVQGNESNIIQVTLDASDFTFGRDEIKVKQGNKVVVTVNNKDGFHDFVIDELKVNSGNIPEGSSKTIEFTADKAGEYEYYCSVGKHREMGMKGKLVVE